MASLQKKIKEIRTNKNLSQEKFGKLLGYSKGYIANIETGRTKPSRRFLEAIQKKCGVSIDSLINEKINTQPIKKEPKHPGLRELLFITYDGKEREKIEAVLNEGEYTLFERLIATNAVLIYLDAAMHDDRLNAMIIRTWASLKSEPTYKNDESYNTLEEYLHNIPKLKGLATLALSEGPQALFDYFYQFISFDLEFWDFDFDTFTLMIKLYNYDYQSVPLLISKSQLLLSDEATDISNKLSNAIIATLKDIENSLNNEQRLMFYEIMKGGIELIVKRAIDEYLVGR